MQVGQGVDGSLYPGGIILINLRVHGCLAIRSLGQKRGLAFLGLSGGSEGDAGKEVGRGIPGSVPSKHC